ncbi:MAG: response regulator [Gammaproteobacteria bacterium]|nr:MAG: response regulator [Gammaproteobacteria bacterium]
MATILAVDDSKAMRDMVSVILTSAGHEAHLFADGTQAIEFARKQSVDLVLADVNMPGMTGINMVSKLRGLEYYANTPILMLTTESSGYKKDKAKQSGANGWISKPVTADRLLAAINKVLPH